MGNSLLKSIARHFKRLAYACVGIEIIGLAVFRRTVNEHPIPSWQRLLGIAVGCFFLYVASMYYFPKNIRGRAELNALLDEAEAADRRQHDGN